MRRAIIILISIAVAFAMYAALDDITTGTEPSYVLEWCAVAVGVLWFAVLAILIARTKTRLNA